VTEFPVERRDLLRTTGAGVLGATGLSRASGRQDTSGGDLIWTFTPDVFGATVTGPSSPTVIDDAVYVGSLLSGDTDTATAHAVDTASGEQVETFDALSSSVNNCIHSSPAVVDGWVYLCGGRGNSVHRFDASDGTNDWSVDIGGNLFASPTVTGETVFIHRHGSGGIDASESVHALAADSGEELWTFDTGVSNGSSFAASSPTVVDGTVFVGMGHGTVYALDAENGDENWVFEPGGTIDSSPTVADGRVFVGKRHRRPRTGGGLGRGALDVRNAVRVDRHHILVTDSRRWHGVCRHRRWNAVRARRSLGQQGPGHQCSGHKDSLVTDGTVFVGTGTLSVGENGVYAFEEGSGDTVWQFETDPSGRRPQLLTGYCASGVTVGHCTR
jgi:outer membrane protein assembly factor BamB